MANNIDISKLIGEINTLNKAIKDTSTIMSELITKQDKLNKEISGAKNLKTVNEQLNKTKKVGNEIEKEAERLAKKRNSLIAKQDQGIKSLTKETIKQNEKVKEQNRLYREQAKAELGIKKRTGLFKAMTKSIISAGAAFLTMTGIIRAADAGKELSKIAAQAEGVNTAFKKLPNSVKIMREMKAATRGTVSELELMKAAVKANEFNIPIEKMGTIMAFAAKQAEVMGEDIDYMVNSVVTGLARGSVKILDNLGLSAKELGEEAKITGDITSAAFNVIDRKLKESGTVLDNLNTKQKRWAASWENIKLKAGTAINTIIFGSQKQSDKLRKVNIELNANLNALKNQELPLKVRNDLIQKTNIQYGEYLPNLLTEKDTIEDIEEIQVKANKALFDNIRLKAQEEFLQDQINKISKTGMDITKQQLDIEKLKLAAIKAQDSKAIERDIVRREKKLAKLIIKEKEERLELTNLQETLAKLNIELGINTKKTEEGNEEIEERARLLEKINGNYKIYNQFLRDQTTKFLGEEAKKTEGLSDELLKRNEKNLKALEQQEYNELESLQRRKDAVEFFGQAASEVSNTLFSNASTQRDMELSEIQSNYAAQIDAADGNAQLQAKLAADLEKEQKRIRHEQAVADRNQALFNIAINTAVAVSKVYGQTGIFGIAAEIPVIAMGLLQAGLVASQPLPGFFTGTESAPEGLAYVAEKGRELIESNGKMSLVDNQQVYDFKGGETVYNNADTERMLNAAIYKDIAVNGNEGIENRLDTLIHKMDTQTKEVTMFDDNGIQRYLQQGNSKTIYLNKKQRK